ncbi:MAG: hypothetical protein JWO38_635 [Gemmataceae bacterium]|nr:hypothetical protein [Gemmataceae bacterium]
MLVGFDTEYGFRSVRTINGRPEADITTGVPVCAALVFEDGRELQFIDEYSLLGEVLSDPRYTFVVHGAHAELLFCRLAGIRFPDRHVDTLTRGVLLTHASTFEPVGGAYAQAGLAALTTKFGIPFVGADDKDEIRDSILHLRHREEFGMPAVAAYCTADARACLRLAGPLNEEVARTCGANAGRNLTVLFEPYAQDMADVAAKGIRFDRDGWDRLLVSAGVYRDRLLRVMRQYGYDHDGGGLGVSAFKIMVTQLGLARAWPRTPTGQLRTREADLKDRRHLHEALRAAHRLIQFDALMGQRLGDRVDRDGRLRCGILPFAQRSSRTSTVRPNLMGIPGELRPLLLPDEGCKFVHFDYSQQEPGVAGYLSHDTGLMNDFAAGDVYTAAGRRMGLVTDGMTPAEVKDVRNGLLKALMLSIIYGKSAAGIARDLPCSDQDARLHLGRFEQTYPRLFAFLRSYVSQSMERGWAENVIGFRAAFDVRDPKHRSHVARSCQNFPIQSSAAACFQVTGLHLAEFGADIRLPVHDAYLLNVPDDPAALAEAVSQIAAATEAATDQLFPGLAVKRDVEILDRFAKDGKVDSFARLLASLEPEEELCPVG